MIDIEKIVLLVIDEAHRASGNYSYCNVVTKLETLQVGFRILSLSATPVSKIENLQPVINALRVSMLEVRSELDQEIKKYTFEKNITELIIPKDNFVKDIENLILKLMDNLIPYFKAI